MNKKRIFKVRTDVFGNWIEIVATCVTEAIQIFKRYYLRWFSDAQTITAKCASLGWLEFLKVKRV